MGWRFRARWQALGGAEAWDLSTWDGKGIVMLFFGLELFMGCFRDGFVALQVLQTPQKLSVPTAAGVT